MAKKKVKKVPEVVDDPLTTDVDESVEEVDEVEAVDDPDTEVDEAAIDDAADELDSKREVAAEAKAAADEAKAVSDAAARELAEAEQAVKDAEESTSLDPRKFVAIDVGGHGAYSILPMPEGYRQGSRTILILGRTYEHVAEHRGVWAYRHLG